MELTSSSSTRCYLLLFQAKNNNSTILGFHCLIHELWDSTFVKKELFYPFIFLGPSLLQGHVKRLQHVEGFIIIFMFHQGIHQNPKDTRTTRVLKTHDIFKHDAFQELQAHHIGLRHSTRVLRTPNKSNTLSHKDSKY